MALVLAGLIASACRVPTSGVPEYVGSAVCADCHEKETAAWVGSDHDLAMAPATDSTVLGSFDGARFEKYGEHVRFTEQNARFVLELDENGERAELPVLYVFGHFPLQQYLVPFERGRFQSFPIAWDSNRNEWFSLYPGEALTRGEYVHWTGRGMNWNYMCAECHSTNLKKGYDFASDAYSTTYSEIDVSCEACHGPGARHAALAAKGDSTELARDPGLTVRLAADRPAAVEIDVCARCHSRRLQVSEDYSPGDPYFDHYLPELLREDLYFPDGQIKDEVYVYGSFLQSRMYRRGVRCSNCHDAHSGRTKLKGNLLCAQCHVQDVYDRTEHTGHAPGSKAAACVSCHMPERTYMQVDPRRDHSFHLPSPELASRIGAPDACLGCHADRSPEALERAINQWFGDTRRRARGNLAEAVSDVWAHEGDRSEELSTAARDTAFAPITRATALSLMGRFPVEKALGAVSRGLRDAEPLVRLGALRAADDLGVQVAPVLLAPLVEDSVRIVRIEAARQMVLRGADPRDEQIPGFDGALEEYRAAQAVNADQPGSHVNLAVLAESLDEPSDAEKEYGHALRLDSVYVPALVNYALLLNRRRLGEQLSEREQSDLKMKAESMFEEASGGEGPAASRAAYYLGLLLAEDPERVSEAASHLERAADEIGNDARVYYNAGLAFQRASLPERAERHLKRAAMMDTLSADYINALVIFYLQSERWRDARAENDRLLRRYPTDSGIAERAAYIEARLSRADSLAGQ